MDSKPASNIKPKTAKKKVCAVELFCPHCDDLLAAPGGSLFWDVNEIETGKVIECFYCKGPVKLPKT